MNQPSHEPLSALMDGELPRDEMRFLLKRLDTDAQLPLRWERYHVVRHTLRGQLLMPLPASFAERVMAQLATDSAPSSARQYGAWVRWGAGGAIAASVAVAALMVAQPRNGLSPAPQSDVRMANAQRAPAANAATVAVAARGNDFRTPLLAPNVPVETAPVNFGSDLSQPALSDREMRSYLLRHYESAGGYGQPAFVPYVLLSAPQATAPAAH